MGNNEVNHHHAPTNRIKKPNRKWSPKKRSDYFWGYVLIGPIFLGLLTFYIFPVFQTFYFSFTEWGDFGGHKWAGLDNYKKVLSDPNVWFAFRNTFLYAILMVPLSIAISIFVAVLVNQKIKGLTLYRTLYFIPVVTMPVAIGVVWKWLYNGDYGIINYLLSFIGIEGQRWLTSPNTAMAAIIVVGIWSIIGYNMIIFLSGLQGIPKSFYESAELDGAGPIAKFFKITLPLLSPTIFFVIIITSIEALQMFDYVFVMIPEGSPALENTQTVIYLFYKYAFVLNDKGMGAAIVFLLFILILIVTIVQFRMQKKWVHY